MPKESRAKSKYSKADVEAAVRNLVKKGLVVAREDANGKTVYFCPEHAPPSGPFELESYRLRVSKEEGRSELPLARSRAAMSLTTRLSR